MERTRMAIEHIRLSKQAREQLIRLKRYTGIEHWNVLCRWAFCRSLAEPSVPPPARIPADSNVEISWKVFGGRHQEIYMALLKERCLRDGLAIEDEVLATQFRLHLHRGIAYLASDRQIRDGVAAFVAQAVA
jgi:DNA sulfur modification protein DndE